jgi:hypothetical protein
MECERDIQYLRKLDERPAMTVGYVLYPKWKQAMLQEGAANKSLDQPDATNGTYCALVTITGGGYIYSQAHQFYSDLGANIQGTPQQITTPTVNMGTVAGATGPVFDGDNCTFISLSGPAIGACVLYRHNSGANTTWRLVYYFDETDSGLPVTPAGGNVFVTWNASGIFQW